MHIYYHARFLRTARQRQVCWGGGGESWVGVSWEFAVGFQIGLLSAHPLLAGWRGLLGLRRVLHEHPSPQHGCWLSLREGVLSLSVCLLSQAEAEASSMTSIPVPHSLSISTHSGQPSGAREEKAEAVPDQGQETREAILVSVNSNLYFHFLIVPLKELPQVIRSLF